MATIGLSRGKTETILSLAAPGLAPNDYRFPQDLQGARMSWQTITSGPPTVNSVTVEVSLDGVNWMPSFDTSATLATEVRVVAIEGIMGVRARWVSTTGGTAVVVLIRVA